MADGYIIIDTSIQTKGFEEGTKSLEQACRNAANSIQGIGDNAKAALNKSVDAFAKKNAALAQQQKKVADAQKEVDALSGKQVETPEFSELNRKINQLEASLERVSYRRKKFIQTGGKTDSRTFAGIEYDLDHIGEQLDSLTAKKIAMLEGGTAYTPADTSRATAKLEAEQAKLSQMNRELNTSFDALNAKFKKYGASISGASGKMGVFATLAQRIKGVLANVANAFRKTSDGANKFGNSVNKAAKNTKSVLAPIVKNTAALSLLYSALFAVRNAITQGFQNLAQASAPANKSISSLVSALTQLKNSFAAAFAPVLNVVVPILNTLINAISRALSAIGRFLAALTGKKTFMQATAVQEDYAASLGATGSAAGSAAKELKELQNLSGLDEINTFQTAKDTGSSGGGGGGGGSIAPSDMFEEVEISPKLLAFAEKVKSLFGGIVERVKQFGRDIAEETKTWFSNLDFGPISMAFEGLVEAIEPFVDVCLDGLEWVYTNILLPLGKWTIEKGAPAAIDLLTAAFAVLTAVAQKLGEWGKILWDNFLQPLANWAGDAVVSLFEGLADAFEWIAGNDKAVSIIAGITVATLAWKVAQGLLNAVLTANPIGYIIVAVAGLISLFTDLIEVIDMWVNDFKLGFSDFTTSLGKLAKGAWAEIKGDTEGAEEAYSDMWRFIHRNTEESTKKNNDILQNAADTVKNAAAGLSQNVENTTCDLAESTDENLMDVYASIKNASWESHDEMIEAFKDMGVDVTDDLEDLGFDIDKLMQGMANDSSTAGQDIYAGMTSQTSKLPGAVKKDTQAAAKNVSSAWESASVGTADEWKKMNTDVTTSSMTMKNTITSNFSIAEKSMKDTATRMSYLIKDTFADMNESVSATFERMCSSVTGAFSSLKNNIKNPINGIIGHLNNMNSRIAQGMNNLATSMSRFKIAVPGSSPLTVSVSRIGSVARIPYLATGAVIPPNSPFLAVMGDQKRGQNIEAPADLIRQIVREEAGGGGNVTFTAQLNRRTIFEQTIEEAKLRQLRTGKNPFALA